LTNKKTYYAYIGFKLEIINDLVLDVKEKDKKFRHKLKDLANEQDIKNFGFDNKKLKELERKLENEEKLILLEYRKNRDKLGKLRGLLRFLKERYEDFNSEISFQIPFTISDKGYGILQGVQLPDNSPETIRELIDFEPLEERLKGLGFNRDKDNIDIVLTCHSTKGISKEKIEFIIAKLQSYGEIFLYIGDKLYIVREDATRNEEIYNLDSVGRKKELAVMKYIYEKIEELIKELDLIFRHIV
jgi:hypothetical protein